MYVRESVLHSEPHLCVARKPVGIQAPDGAAPPVKAYPPRTMTSGDPRLNMRPHPMPGNLFKRRSTDIFTTTPCGIGDLPCIRFDLLAGASWTLVLRSRRIGEGRQILKEWGEPLTPAEPTNGSRFFPLSLTRQVKLAAWFLFNECRARQFGNLAHHDAWDSLMKDPTKQLATLCTS